MESESVDKPPLCHSKQKPLCHLKELQLKHSQSISPLWSPLLQYYGGPVISAVNVFIICWGGLNKVKYAGDPLEGFYTGMTGTEWFKSLNEYNTPNQTIGSGSFIGSYPFVNATTGTITDAQIQAALTLLIADKSLPKPITPDFYYAISLIRSTKR